MQVDPKIVNPYSPPATVSHRLIKNLRTFQIGEEEVSTLLVSSTLWKGVLIEVIDEKGNLTASHRGACDFEVGSRKQYRVRIEADQSARLNMYVDDRLYEENLFAQMRRRIIAITSMFTLGVTALIVAVFIQLM